MAFNQYVRTSISRNIAEARPKVIDLYRKSLRSVPALIAQYELDFDVLAMKQRIRRDFELHKDITDPRVVDKLLFLGVTELEEARLVWKQTCHVEYYFEKETLHKPGMRPNLNIPQGVIPKPSYILESKESETTRKTPAGLQYREIF